MPSRVVTVSEKAKRRPRRAEINIGIFNASGGKVIEETSVGCVTLSPTWSLVKDGHFEFSQIRRVLTRKSAVGVRLI